MARVAGEASIALAVAALFLFAGCQAPSPAPPAAASAAQAASPAQIVATPFEQKKLDVHLVPLGDVSLDTLADAAAALRKQARLDVIIEARVPLPATAKTNETARYSADALLAHLASLPISRSTQGKVVGVTALDIVSPKNGVKNWGVLGLGSLDGRSCVFSTYRMKRAFEKGGGASEAVVRDRLWKVALHELGHTLGLDHCPNKGCIMEDAGGTVKTVDAETALCPRCAKNLADAIARTAEP